MPPRNLFAKIRQCGFSGSLIVEDTNGNAFVPTRVGFRTGGNGKQYVVETTDGGVVRANFYRPTTDALNMGLVGMSVNTQRSGLRFVHRLNITQSNDKLYMLADGEPVEVKEYGLLVAS